MVEYSVEAWKVMEFVVSAIVSWIVNNILNRFFFRARKTDQIIEVYEGRLAEKDRNIERLRKERKKREKERHHIIQALKRSGLSTDKLVARYDRPLNAILLSYATQKEQTPTGSTKECKFVLDELQKYNVKYLGGTDALIPPTKVPRSIKNSNDLRTWFETDILKGRYCKLKFLALIDLRKKTFWNVNLPYVQIHPKHFTIGEVLSIEDLFTEKELKSLALSDIVRDGDIAWLASSLLSRDELEVIHTNQPRIEELLGNPSLRLLSKDDMVSKLSTVLAQYQVPNPAEISRAIVEEAKFWNSRLR